MEVAHGGASDTIRGLTEDHWLRTWNRDRLSKRNNGLIPNRLDLITGDDRSKRRGIDFREVEEEDDYLMLETGDAENRNWQCKCPTGYIGATCETSVCDNNPCQYGGTCIPYPGSGYLCLCPFGKHGHYCEHSEYKEINRGKFFKDLMRLRSEIDKQKVDFYFKFQKRFPVYGEAMLIYIYV